MAKASAPQLKMYDNQKRSDYVNQAQTMSNMGGNWLTNNSPSIDYLNDKTRAGIEGNLNNIYNQSYNDASRNFKDNYLSTLQRDYNATGTLNDTGSLYRRDMGSLNEQRQLANLAYQKSMNRENLINNELSRRYDTANYFNNLFGKGSIPQKYEDQDYSNYRINTDRQYQNDVSNYMKQQELGSNITGTVIDVATLALMLSDVRAKQDIKKINKLSGINIYTFKYKPEYNMGTDTHIGVLAQEVENIIPNSVHEINGIKYVDYNAVNKYIMENN